VSHHGVIGFILSMFLTECSTAKTSIKFINTDTTREETMSEHASADSYVIFSW